MNSKCDLLETALGIFEKRGRTIIEKAACVILDSPYDRGPISSALHYYANVTLRSVLPVFPALMSLSCEAAGGNPENTKPIAVPMVLLTSSGDIHDDIIDKSTNKYSKKTVFGKFGANVALLAGDALFVQGENLLQRACEALGQEQRQEILGLVPQALFEISKAEAKEIQLWKQAEVPGQQYLEVTRMKGVVAEVQCRIGGILAKADEKTVKSLGHYGRTIGMLSTIKDEFGDTADFAELKHRMKNECPPLPILYALQDADVRRKIRLLIQSPRFVEEDAEKLAEVAFGSKSVQKLRKKLISLAKTELKNIDFIKEKVATRDATALLEALTECL
jgi:geranylgeranyl diphosphate synthase type I